MTVDQIQVLENEIAHLIGGQGLHHRPLRWTRDGYAQGVLLDLLDQVGFTHRFLQPLACRLGADGGDAEVISGSQFQETTGTRSFTAYDADAGVALVMASAMALRACGRRLARAVA